MVCMNRRANETFAKALRLTEANGRAWMGHNTELRDYLCALTGVTDQGFVKCAGKSEEIMVCFSRTQRL